MSAPFILEQGTGLVVAVILGFFFGVSLERGGLGDPHKLTGIFYLRDFVVPKVMFTAIVVASLGLYLLSDLKVLDMSRVWIVPTYFWPQMAGGAIFGLGFLLSGYCPGTAVAGLAGGRIDALVTMIGILVGSILFAVVYPLVEGFYVSSAMGKAILPEMMGVNHWVVLAGVVVMALAMFISMEWFEKKRGR